jgi:uncharacterized membrane protein
VNTQNKYAVALVTFGLIGLIASFLLTIDTMKLIGNPDLDLPCNLSPFISCSSVIDSSQGKIFGFPNPLLGIAGFSFVATVGFLMLFGAEPNKKFWKIFLAGISLAIIFIHWLIYESIFVLGNLCLYCMATWAAIWPIFIGTIKNFQFSLPAQAGIFNFQFLRNNHFAIIIGWYLLIILLILIRFREYFFLLD